jgi:hypothetical protein
MTLMFFFVAIVDLTTLSIQWSDFVIMPLISIHPLMIWVPFATVWVLGIIFAPVAAMVHNENVKRTIEFFSDDEDEVVEVDQRVVDNVISMMEKRYGKD